MTNQTKIKQRLDFIDYAKGIAILMMLLGHSVPHSESIHIAIFSFHMPFFFIVCGYLAYLKYPYGLAFGGSGYYFLRRERNILEPYIVFGFILICLYCFFDFLSLHTLSDKTISRIVSWITLGGVDSMWFLPVYFFSECIFLFSRHYMAYRHLWLFLWVLIFVLICFTPMFPRGLLRNIMSGYLFVVIGYFFAHYRVHVMIRKPLALLFMVIGIIWSLNFGFASMQNMHNPLLYICNAAIINLSLLSICYYTRLTSQRIRSSLFFFGINTIIVLCTNNLVIEILRMADYRFTGNFMMYNGTIGDLLFFILLSFAEIPLIWFFMNRFPRRVPNVNIPIKQ